MTSTPWKPWAERVHCCNAASPSLPNCCKPCLAALCTLLLLSFCWMKERTWIIWGRVEMEQVEEVEEAGGWEDERYDEWGLFDDDKLEEVEKTTLCKEEADGYDEDMISFLELNNGGKMLQDCRLVSVELEDSREETKLPRLGEDEIPESTFDLVDLVEEVEEALLFLLFSSWDNTFSLSFFFFFFKFFWEVSSLIWSSVWSTLELLLWSLNIDSSLMKSGTSNLPSLIIFSSPDDTWVWLVSVYRKSYGLITSILFLPTNYIFLHVSHLLSLCDRCNSWYICYWF